MDTANPIQTLDLSKNSTQLFRFILSIIVLMSLGFVASSSILITGSLDQLYNNNVELEAAYLEDSLNEFLQTKISTMKDSANFPLIVNSVMHPEHNHAFLKDFMEDLYLQESRVDYTLVDINGEMIQSNAVVVKKYWQENEWVSKLVEGGLPHYIELFEEWDRVSILIAVPVIYNGHIEGVLVGVFASDLDYRLYRLLRKRALTATIYSNGLPVHEFGNRPKQGFSFQGFDNISKKRIELPIINGALELEIYKSEINEVLFSLITSVLIVVSVFSLLFIFVFKRLGFKLFIRPQLLIEQSIVATMAVNKKLAAANEELAQFAYRASHDLKAPLVTTRGLADFIQQDIEAGEYDEAKANAGKISNHVARLEKLVIDILDLAKADLEISNKEKINLNELIHDIQERLEISSIDNNVSIELEVSKNFSLFVSRTRISQVLENLISNAIKYADPTKESRFVKVTAANAGGDVEIKVNDNGLGIPAEFHQKIFQMFQRFHPEVSYGSGLGMYIVKKHTDNMQAELSFTSSPAGSEFKIVIPQSL